MNKRAAIFAVLCTAVVICVVAGMKPYKNNIWDKNADAFVKSLDKISETTTIQNFSEITPFEWDTMFVFAPYTPKENIYGIIGYEWDTISDTVSDGENIVVFLKDKKVVCTIEGTIDKAGVYIEMDMQDNYYRSISSQENVKFNYKLTEDGKHYLKYIG